MQKLFIAIIVLSCFVSGVMAQSGRFNQPETPNQNASLEYSPEKMYREANDYARVKFVEFEQKKTPFSENLRLQTIREQKQLAAKYAAQLSTLNRLSGEDFYYLGMLHWIAENIDGAEENFKLYAASENPDVEKAQTARSVLTVILARRKSFDEAEKILVEYLNNPVKPRERSKMENELAIAYFDAKNYPRAAAHAEEAYRVTKSLFQESTSRARGLAEILDAGRTVYEIYKTSGNVEKTDAALEELRKAGALTESSGIYYFAMDNLIKYMIETNRKPAAMTVYKSIEDQIGKDFSKNKPLQDDLIRRFSRREKHYQLFGDPAPELVSIANWLPGNAQTLTSLRGKVVLLDFWATWCGPCIETFPALVKMYENHHKDGLEIIGVTRFYGQAEGQEADRKTELAAIGKFKQKYTLPYGFAIADNQLNQITYGAQAIPTAVVIDRKGIIRYIESGTNSNREQEIREAIEKILAEK